MTTFEISGDQIVTSINESTTIVHRTVGTSSMTDHLLRIGGLELWHTDETRERIIAKLIDQWVANGWSDDIETCYLESRAKRGLVMPAAQIGQVAW